MQQKGLSTKDLSYLCDMFNWNLNCYNAFTHFEQESNDEQAKTLMQNIAQMHKNSCEHVLSLIK